MTVLIAALLSTPCLAVALAAQSSPDPGDDPKVSTPTSPSTSPSPSTLPWKLGRSYKYVWLRKKEKIGETTFRWRRDTRDGAQRPDAPGDAGNHAGYVLSSRRRLETDGKVEESEGTLRLLANGRPLVFREETSYRMAATGNFRGRQELKVSFQSAKATVSYVTNRNFEDPSSHSVPLAKKGPTYLFSTYGIEQWNLFTLDLARAKTTTIEVVYPEFARRLRLELEPARGTERLDIGDRHLNTTRYDFRVKQWKWSGSIWIDARGRMLRYKSADLSLQLTAVPE